MLIDHLTSAAKVKIFKLLVRVRSPLCFREIVDLANIGIRSAQIALADFQRLRIIKLKKQKNKVLYTLIESELSREVRKIIDQETKSKIVENSKIYSKSAKNSIKTIQALYEFGVVINQIKEKM